MFFNRKKPKKYDPNSRRARFACIKNQVKKREIIEIIVLKILIFNNISTRPSKKIILVFEFFVCGPPPKREKKGKKGKKREKKGKKVKKREKMGNFRILMEN